MRDRFHFQNRWTVEATLSVRTGLSIAKGLSLEPTGSDLPVMKTPQGEPFIPGSSLKGAVRAYVERLLRSLEGGGYILAGQDGPVLLWACDPLDDRARCVVAACPSHERARCETRRELGKCDCPDDCKYCQRCKACMVVRATDREGRFDDDRFSQELWARLCVACRLFGSPWMASRVRFEDAFLANGEELVRVVEVRQGVGIDRDLGTARPQILFDFEAVPGGATFHLRMHFENTEDWEVGLVLLALRAMERGALFLGGKTTRGLGQVGLGDISVRRVDAKGLLEFLRTGREEEVNPEVLEKAFTERLQTREGG